MRLYHLALALGMVTFTACNGDSSGPGTTVPKGELEVDATSTSTFATVDLTSGTVVTVADPSTSNAWNLGFRRYEIRVNGGVAGPGGVSGYNLANNAGATSEQVLAMTPDNQKAAFDAVGLTDIPDAGSFVTEALVANPLGWLNFAGGAPTASASSVWKLRRTADGGYAVFHFTGLTIGGTTPQTAVLATATVEWRYQPAGGVLGNAQQATLDREAGNDAIDLSTGTLSAATGCGWDVAANADFSVTTNADCDVGTFPLDAAQSFSGLTDASDAPEYGLFLSGLTGPVPFSTALDDPNGPFLYNLAGDNRLSPTFNIFLIKIGTDVYKVQVIGYYSATGVSGHPTIRFAKIQ